MKEDLANRRISRGMLMLALTICLALACSGVAIAADNSQNHGITTGGEAWQKLMEGNQRFVAGARADRDFVSRRAELTAGQHPFATIITCSDSRVPPELLFDQGLGDLFIIRDAGNVVDGIELGSVEYGVEHCHTPVLVVLGHSSCGAVTAAVGGGAEGNIEGIMHEIEPALETAKETGKTDTELIEETVNENVKLVIQNILDRSPVTKELFESGNLTIVGAKYFLETGEVTVIDIEGIPSPAVPTLSEVTPPSLGDVYERPAITTADEAWDELMRGNQRFVAGNLADRDFPNRRAELTAGQHPFATIITCSDSRVPPELLFDQGLGDVFIIRDAGNVVDGIELGSVEYGVEHCHTPLLVVLGHSSCGAVTAAVGGGAEGNIGTIMDEIEPALETAKETNKTGIELIEETVNENLKLVIQNILDRSPVTKELVENGKLEIVGAKYFLDTGKVEVIEVVDATSLAEVTTPAPEETPEPTATATPTAEEPTPTPTPTPTQAPSFGAVLAMAGILVVAYFVLLRRRM